MAVDERLFTKAATVVHTRLKNDTMQKQLMHNCSGETAEVQCRLRLEVNGLAKLHLY